MLIMVFVGSSLPFLNGCTYMCHRYDGFEEEIPSSGWRIDGSIFRWYAEDRVPAKYSTPHWGARNDDRYWLTMVPVAPDSGYWAGGDVELVNVWVIAGQDTLSIEWEERISIFDKPKNFTAGRGEGYERASVRFNSKSFHLSKPVPDILLIEYEFVIFDKETREALSSWNLRSTAVVDRHRRWVIMDGIES